LKALITDEVHPHLIDRLTAAGYECDYRPAITDADVRRIIAEYDGLIINSKINVDKEMQDRAIRLRWVGRLGSGMEIVDREYAKQKKIAVYSSPEGNRNAVAEHALGMLLAVANNLVVADREVRQKKWEREKNRGWELAEKTIGIIGFGHTGSTFGRKLAGLDMRVLAYDKYLPSGFAANYSHIEETNLEKIFEEADIISLHLPLNQETKYLVDTQFLEKFRKTIVLINTSRGGIVCTKDVLFLLKNKKIKAACLDVFENEKPTTFSPEEHILYDDLYKLPNLILSPHIAGWTNESKFCLAKILADKILQE
jgi:D-3-phosphoglycerate dehydrogenase